MEHNNTEDVNTIGNISQEDSTEKNNSTKRKIIFTIIILLIIAIGALYIWGSIIETTRASATLV